MNRRPAANPYVVIVGRRHILARPRAHPLIILKIRSILNRLAPQNDYETGLDTGAVYMREIPVTKVDKTVRIPREISEKVKQLGLKKEIKYMKKEIIDCPLHKKEISPIYCLVCPYFVRRVKGKIYCKYP